MNEKSMDLLLWYQSREPTLLLLRSKTDSKVVQLGVHNWCQWQSMKIVSLSIMCQSDHSLKDLYKLLPIAVIVMPLLGFVYISDCYIHVWYLWRSENGVRSKESQLYIVMSHHISAENWTQVLCWCQTRGFSHP